MLVDDGGRGIYEWIADLMLGCEVSTHHAVAGVSHLLCRAAPSCLIALLLRIDLGLVRRRHRNHLRHRDHLPLPQLILDQLSARDHEQSLPDPETHPRRDAAEQTFM